MTFENPKTNIVKFVSLSSPKVRTYAISDNKGGIVHVYNAVMIRLLSEALRVGYEVLTPADESYGIRQPNGSWSGIIGMILRSEADLAIRPLTPTYERLRVFNLTYPVYFSRVTFMTDRPKPLSKNLAVIYPFSVGVWIAMLALLIAVSIALHFVMRFKIKFQRLSFNVLGNLLEKSLSFETRASRVRILLTAWLLAALILSNSYKAVLFSFLSVPRMVGLRSISDLHKASAERSVQCFGPKSSLFTQTFLNSSIQSWKAVGKCLERTQTASQEETYFTTTSRKAYIGAEIALDMYERQYFISEDSFYIGYYAFMFSKHFCCPNRLNEILHRLAAAGLVEHFRHKEHFFVQLKQNSTFDSDSSADPSPMSLDDVSGAFILLLSGWILSLITLLAEIAARKLDIAKF